MQMMLPRPGLHRLVFRLFQLNAQRQPSCTPIDHVGNLGPALKTAYSSRTHSASLVPPLASTSQTSHVGKQHAELGHETVHPRWNTAEKSADRCKHVLTGIFSKTAPTSPAIQADPGQLDAVPNVRTFPSYPVRTVRSFSSEPAAKYVVGNGAMTMKGVVLPGPNEPMYLESFRIPKPKIGEVLIKTKACGVCHTDLHVIKGEQKFPTPGVLGHEVSGTVMEHGPGTDPATVRRLPVGARVVGAFIMPCGGCFFCTRGQEEICETFFEYNRGKGTLYDGTTRLYTAKDGTPVSQYSMAGLAEYCVMPASALAVLPEKLPFAESAIMGCAIFTAYGALRNGADLRAGETVAVVGVGGVGGGIVQLAKAFGAKTVIAVDISDEKLTSAKKLGATHVVNGAKENVAEKVREYTGGRGVDVALEALGKPVTFGQALSAVRDGGRAVMVGIAPTGTMAEVEITRIVRKEIRIIGSYGARTRHDLPDVIDLAAMGKFDVAAPVTRRYKLDDAGEAYAALDRGEIDGRAVVLMD